MIDILQEQDASASVLVEIEGKLDCERFCRYWTSDYGRWTHSKRQSNLEMQCCEDAPAAAKAFETQQAILQDMRYRTPAEMIRVVAAYWSQGLNADELGGIFTSSALQGLGSLVYAQEEKGDCRTYRTQLEAAEMLTMLKPGLGYNMQHLTWNDAAGDAAKHISKAEESESIAHALQATQGPQQLLDLLEGCDLARYFCQRVPDMPDVHALLQELPCHAFCAKLILAVWRDDQGDWKEHAEDLSSVQKEEMQRAADDSQRQQERRVRHAQSALQMLMDNREETGPPEDPQQNWRLGAASADDAMGAVRISLRRWLLRS
ncbi:TPA: hypothetical protein ACH3X3_002296 [Trebouxia sp. C0006]